MSDVSVEPADEVGPTEWGENPNGVGPWAEFHGTDLPTDERYDPLLLLEGDRRNVLDEYRYWTREAIVEDIDSRRHPMHVAIENFAHDANIGTVVRTANAFAAAAVHIVGGDGGTAAAPWSPIGTNTSFTMLTSASWSSTHVRIRSLSLPSTTPPDRYHSKPRACRETAFCCSARRVQE